MSIYNIGMFLKLRREEMGITQEELCEGICSIPTLSRIENEHGTPTQKHIRSLLQRLGYSDIPAFIAQDSECIEIVNLLNRISNDIALRKCAEAEEHLKELKKHSKHFDSMDWLVYENGITMLGVLKNELTNEEALERYEKAILTIHPSYSRDNLPKVLTNDEGNTLNCIAVYLAMCGNTIEALKIFYHLKNYYKSRIVDADLACKLLPMIYYNISKLLGKLGLSSEAIDICNEGIDYCKSMDVFANMPRIMYNKAWGLLKRNLPGDREEARKIANEAYVLATVFENRPTLIPRIENFLKESFNEEPPKF